MHLQIKIAIKKRMKIIFIQLILIHFYFISFTTAQEHTHRFYSVYDGIAQSQVMCIAQDSAGYIWIGTKGGVARFDGHIFENFTIKNGLVSNFIYKIIPTDSCIWFISTNGITVYQNNKFIPYFHKGAAINLSGMYKGKFIFNEEEIQNLQFENGQFVPAKFEAPLKKPFVYYQFELNPTDSSYFAWSIKKGLYKLTKNNDILIDSAGAHFCILHDKNKLYYYSQNQLKDCLLDLTTSKMQDFELPEFEIVLEFRKINSIDILFNNRKVGVYINNKLQIISKDFNLVRDVFIDKNKNIWVADEDGLYFFNKLVFIEFTKINSKILPYIWDIKEFPNSTYWFASCSHGLQTYNGDRFKAEKVETKSNQEPIRWFYFNTPPADNKMMILNHAQATVKYVNNSYSKLLPDINQDYAGLVTFYDSTQKTYLIGAADKKLFVGDGINPTKVYYGSDTTFQKNILAICYDKDNTICLGHDGISKFEDGKFKSYPNIPDSIDFRVFSLQKDHKGNLWIGTDKGLWFYNYDTIFQINKKYFNSTITFLKMVDTTWLMGGTTLGLPLLYLPDFYKDGTQRVKYYDRFNGFTGRDCGQNGTLHDSKNTFWIPTVDRVLRFDPTKIEFNTKPPTVHMKGISLLGKNLSWNFIGDTVHQLRHDENGIKFSYIGLNYSAPERVRYKYRLLDFGNIWSEETAEREAVFTNLKPGKYTFELLACNEDDYWIEKPIQFSFAIIPAWYQRLFVKAGFFLLFLFILTWITIRIMKRRAKIQKKELELQIALQKEELEKQEFQKLYQNSQLNAIHEKLKGQDEERTRIARELHDGIGGNLVGLKLLMEQACENPKQNEISGLVNIVSNTLEEVRTISHNLMPPEFSGISLNQILQLHIEKLNKGNRIKFSIQFLPQKGWENIPENIQVEIYRIVQELCSNMLKYSNASVVDIQLSQFDNTIHLIMEDDGKPFDYNKNGIGYRNIKERLHLLQGTFEKSCGNEKGNTYHIEIPILKNE